MNKIGYLCVCISLSSQAVAACEISLIPLNFSDYDSMRPLYSIGELTLSDCAVEPVRISLNAGLYSKGKLSPRYMSVGNNNKIAYNLYQNNQYSIIWGDGHQGTQDLYAKAGRYLIYGKVEAGQLVKIGKYRDSVQVLVEW